MSNGLGLLGGLLAVGALAIAGAVKGTSLNEESHDVQVKLIDHSLRNVDQLDDEALQRLGDTIQKAKSQAKDDERRNFQHFEKKWEAEMHRRGYNY
ncbi:MAG: hypothetical protein ACI4J3_03390 [Oscillospiraceae bacterium]